MFNAADLAKNGPHETTMPYTARNTHFLAQEYNFHGWDLKTAQAHGVDVGSTVHKEPAVAEVEKMARAWLQL